MNKIVNKTLSLILSVLLVVPVFPAFSGIIAFAVKGTPDTSWYNAIDLEFEISTSDQLAGLAELVNNKIDNFDGKTITLIADIDLSAYGEYWNVGKGWVPIGEYEWQNERPFKGIFDGNNKIIDGLFINDSYVGDHTGGAFGTVSGRAGLFGYIENGTVKDLGVRDCLIQSPAVAGDEYLLATPLAGGIAAAISSTRIENCYVKGVVIGSWNVGGLIGSAEENSIINNSYSNSTVIGDGNLGGLVGGVYGSSITNSYIIGNVSGSSERIGGVAGYLAFDGNVSNCYVIGSVNGDSNFVGGVAGDVYGSSVENCYSVSIVNAGGVYVGGVVGFLTDIWSGDSWNYSSVINCVALNPNISGEPARRVVSCHYGLEGILSGNRAFEDMIVIINDEYCQEIYPIDKGHDKADGEDISKVQTLSAMFWTDTMNWSEEVWDITDGRLPILKNVGGLQTTGIISVAPDTNNNQVTVNLISPWTSDAVLIVAVYNDQKLLRIKTKPITQSGNIIVEDIEIPVVEGTVVKAMMWNNTSDMVPLCEAKAKVMHDDNWDDIL